MKFGFVLTGGDGPDARPMLDECSLCLGDGECAECDGEGCRFCGGSGICHDCQGEVVSDE